MKKGCKGIISLIAVIIFFLPPFILGQSGSVKPGQIQEKKALSPEAIRALNSCVDYVNEVVYQTRWLQQGLVAYNLHANYFHGVDFTESESNGNLSFSVPNFKLPDNTSRIAKSNLAELPDEYRAPLHLHIDSIYHFFREMNTLYQQLSHYIQSQKYKSDNLQVSNEILSSYENLFSNLDTQCIHFDQLLIKIYQLHHSKKNEDQWDKMYGSIKNVIDNNGDLYYEIKNQFKHQEDSSFVKLTVDAFNQENWLREYNLATSIIEAASTPKQKVISEIYHGIMDQSLTLATKTQQLQPSYFEDHLTYERLTYNYNQSVLLFNRFTDIAPRPFLKKGLKIFLYRHLKLEDESDRRDSLLITDTPLKWVSMEKYAPNHLILLLDVSQSMNTKDKLPLLKQSLMHLIPVMRIEDSLSIIVFSKGSELILDPTSLKNQRKIIDAISSLEPGGSTNFQKGLSLAYDIANKHFIQEGNNRIIVATDGQFNTSKRDIKLIKENEKQNIRLTVFNFSKPNKKIDKKLFKLARKGNGNYEWIDAENSDLMLLKEVQARKKQDFSPDQESDD